MSHRIITLSLVALLATCFSFSQERPKEQAAPHLALVLQSTVQDFFAGNFSESIITYISDGEFNESIPNSELLKKTYTDSKIVFFKAYLTPDKHTAVMTLKTDTRGSERWHTFVMVTNPESKWEIKSWHSSHS